MLNEIRNIGVSGALGAAAGAIVTNPLNGLVFGVVGRLVHEVTEPIFNHLKSQIGSQNVKNLLVIGRFIAVIALSAAACTALGFPLSFATALALQVGQFALVWIGKVIFEDICGRCQAGHNLVQEFSLSKSLVTACSI